MVPPRWRPSEQLADVPDPLRVQAVGGLVEHEQRRSTHQRGSQPESLAHAQRVRLHRTPVARVEADLLEHLVDARYAGPRAEPGGPAAASKSARLARAGQVGVGARALDQRADAWQHRCGGPGIWLAEDLRLAGVGQHQAEEHPHRRRLSGAVGPEEAVDVALTHVEVDLVDGAQCRDRPWSGRGYGSSRRSTRPHRLALDLDRGLLERCRA